MEAGQHNYLHIEFPALPANVGVARVAVASFAAQLEFTWAELEEVKVAVSEAVTNAVVHAYPKGPGPVKVRAQLDGGILAVEVEDQGVGIADVAQARQTSFTTDPERMGLGFTFMESFMDQVEVWSEPGRGTRVSLAKRPSRSQG
ncbi:MAG: anti-sigma F factor [Bacillota bacterium]